MQIHQIFSDSFNHTQVAEAIPKLLLGITKATLLNYISSILMHQTNVDPT